MSNHHHQQTEIETENPLMSQYGSQNQVTLVKNLISYQLESISYPAI